MSGETNLDRLIASMQAVLHPETFVFATIGTGPIPPGAQIVMQFQEAEGTTLILPMAQAEALNLRHEYPCRMITLNIHSALEAVGFLARITNALAAEGMSVNPVSAFFHDHLFVPVAQAELAMEVLGRISKES